MCKLRLIVIGGGVCLTFSCASAQVAQARSEKGGKSFDPPAVYLTWQRDPATTMTIQWHSDGGRVDTVQYQRLDEGVWHSVNGSHHPMSHSDRVVHAAELWGLKPATGYRFRFGEDSVEFKFRTMPRDARKPIRFVVGGDTMSSFDMFGELFETTCIQAAKRDPMFAVIGGDIAYANGNPDLAERWYDWLATWKKQMVTSDGRLIPLLVVIGNHEVRGHFRQTPEKAPFFYSLFAMPGQRGYNVLDFGRYMSLILLDSGHTHPIAGAQTKWLRQTLADRQEVRHLFAVYHVPAYPSVRPADYRVSATIREHWVPLFEQFGLDVAFEHHDHVYKRTHPIRADKIDPLGVLYLGDGTWGVWPRRPREAWYLAKTARKRHFILVTVDSQSRRFLAIDSDGEIFDRIEQPVSSGRAKP
ncbi:MAG: purple acid phosphatase family protein [Candidatus Methylomirabilales bacterium]